MTILSFGSDWIRVVNASGVYHYTELNPYQIRKIKNYVKREACGRAWNLLKKYPCTKETTNAYLQRLHENETEVHV